MIKIEKLDSSVKLPSKANKTDAGFDIYSNESFTLNSSEVRLVRTGFKMQLPDGHVALLRGRSGLAVNGIDPTEFFNPDSKPINILGGVIDGGYRGEVGVILKNLGSQGLKVNIGDKICQMVVMPVFSGEISEGAIDETERGEKGFGSSDKIKKSMGEDPAKFI